MKTLVIYPGRFQPFHKGHKASYDHLVKQFGDVYIATSDVQAPVTSPFSFEDKLTMIAKTGVPTGRVAKVKNPYRAEEIINDVPEPNNTALVFALSAKDMSGPNPRFRFGTKKDGTPSYMQPYPKDGKMQPMSKHAYVYVTPTVNFKVKGHDANSASEIRKLFIDGNEHDQEQIIQDLYGEVDHDILEIFNQRLTPAKAVKDIITKPAPIDAGTVDKMGVLAEHKQRLVKMLESIQYLEKRAHEAYQPLTEDLVVDYIEEKYL